MQITPCRSPWPGTMSSRERFNRQMHWQPVDRSFNMEFGYWQENYREWDLFTENGITNEGEANAFFAFDKIARHSNSSEANQPEMESPFVRMPK